MIRSDRHIQPVMLAALFAVGALSVLGYSCATRTQPVTAESRAEPMVTAQTQRSEPAPPPVDAQPEPLESAAEPTPPEAEKRAAAIIALGGAPKSEALRELENVLYASEADDQRLALRALRALAQSQGDDDGRIRDVIRKVVYHGSDEALATMAQSTLNDIEQDLSARPNDRD